MHRHTAAAAVAALLAFTAQQSAAQSYREPFRPQYHYSPAQTWMNDPNGLLYFDGTYNFFYQNNPLANTDGNLSWGHATGPDLLHWAQQSVAIPFQQNASGQQTELIFSGSAVADTANTSGFGTSSNPPLVAVYAAFYPTTLLQPNGQYVIQGQQSIALAYSLDQGVTWTEYAGNPAVPLPPPPYQAQYQNFRDPKVFWYAPDRKWVMVATLAALHKLVLDPSPDLKNWTPMSTFGPANSTGGAWECPDLFQLPVDGNNANKKWVILLGTNPGAVAGGSGTQYFIGTFNGTRFVADDVLPTAPLPGSTVLQTFEAPTFAATGWTATGGLLGAAPAYGSLTGQQTVTGYLGRQLVNTFLDFDATVGTLTSPPFAISRPYLNFLVGGGYHPFDPATYGTASDTETAVNLLIGGTVVQTATGSNSEHLGWRSWNLTNYQGKTAQIEIIDNSTAGFGHINVDEFVLADAPQQEANWLDWGPDFYAANSWNGLPPDDRVAIAWMNNWDYAGSIPTSPWRGAATIPRQLSLRTIAGSVRLVQQPIAAFSRLLGAPLVSTTTSQTIMPGSSVVPVNGATGRALDIRASFSPGTAREFGLKVRKGHGEETLVGYDARTHQVFVDRFRSGNVSFDPTFAGRYTAPLEPDQSGRINLHVLVDWSSVEVFAGQGEVALTAQIYPAQKSTGLEVFAGGGYATLNSVQVSPVRSIWKH